MEAAIHSIVDSYYSNVADHSLWEEKLLPGAAKVLGTVYHSHPFFVIQRYLDQIGVRSEVKEVL